MPLPWNGELSLFFVETAHQKKTVLSSIIKCNIRTFCLFCIYMIIRFNLTSCVLTFVTEVKVKTWLEIPSSLVLQVSAVTCTKLHDMWVVLNALLQTYRACFRVGHLSVPALAEHKSWRKNKNYFVCFWQGQTVNTKNIFLIFYDRF